MNAKKEGTTIEMGTQSPARNARRIAHRRFMKPHEGIGHAGEHCTGSGGSCFYLKGHCPVHEGIPGRRFR